MTELTDDEISLLRDAFDDAPFEFWARDLEGRLIVANAAGRKLGLELGQKVEDAPVADEVIAAWQANNRRAYAGEVVQNEAEYVSGDARQYLQCYIVPLRVRRETKGILGFNIDVTGRKETERRLDDAMRIARMGWLDWDLVTNEIRWSSETYRLFGYEPGTGFVPTIENTAAMVPAEDRPRVQAMLEVAIAGPAPYDLVHRMIRADGEIIHVHALGKVTRDAHGKPLRLLGTMVDVTERVRAEEELRAVDRLRSEFLGVLSHELRNPLAVIASSVRCIDHDGLADDQARRAIAAIEHQTRHLAHLVDDLLDVTRISSGKIRLRSTTMDLVALVRETIEDHRELLAGRAIVTSIPDAPVWTHGDPTRLAQVLGNLLSNAAKFTPTGGVITVSLVVDAGTATLEVADTGVGIDDESLRRLFVPFMQSRRSVGHSRTGLGLGLALVKTLVEMHGGEVRARSTGPAQGATLTVKLPLIAADPVALRPSSGRTAPPRRVLVIEDDEDVAEWLSEVLSSAGHQVAIAYDADEGLAMARELAPDVVLCDIGLPGALDGYAVARALQSEPSLAAIFRIALSGYAQPDDQKRALDAGFEAHLSKPPDLETLDRLLAQLRSAAR
jgi:PAS domain S-box-containing protein